MKTDRKYPVVITDLVKYPADFEQEAFGEADFSLATGGCGGR